MLEEDTFDAAIRSATLLSDNRIRHFFDKNTTVGRMIADSVDWVWNVAWDIYLFYSPFAEWTNVPPEPVYWMHQLADGMVTKDNYRTGDDLKKELFVSMEKLLSN